MMGHYAHAESPTLGILKLVRRQLLLVDFVENPGAREAAAGEGKASHPFAMGSLKTVVSQTEEFSKYGMTVD